MLAGVAALTVLPEPSLAAPGLVARAWAAAGGAALARVRAVSWSATAQVAGGKHGLVTLASETRIEPFVRARSDTWLAAAGRSTARTVMIERDRGFVVEGLTQRALAAAAVEQERQQLAVFACLLLQADTIVASGTRQLKAQQGGYPPITLGLAADGRVASADYGVTGPGGALHMHYAFTGTVTDKGVRWPRGVAITRNGRPWLRLTIADFAVELA